MFASNAHLYANRRTRPTGTAAHWLHPLKRDANWVWRTRLNVKLARGSSWIRVARLQHLSTFVTSELNVPATHLHQTCEVLRGGRGSCGRPASSTGVCVCVCVFSAVWGISLAKKGHFCWSLLLMYLRLWLEVGWGLGLYATLRVQVKSWGNVHESPHKDRSWRAALVCVFTPWRTISTCCCDHGWQVYDDAKKALRHSMLQNVIFSHAYSLVLALWAVKWLSWRIMFLSLMVRGGSDGGCDTCSGNTAMLQSASEQHHSLCSRWKKASIIRVRRISQLMTWKVWINRELISTWGGLQRQGKSCFQVSERSLNLCPQSVKRPRLQLMDITGVTELQHKTNESICQSAGVFPLRDSLNWKKINSWMFSRCSNHRRYPLSRECYHYISIVHSI